MTQDEQTISLWNLHNNLTRLADELANPHKAIMTAASPRAYFEELLHQCRARDRYFGRALFGEPAWDIMLDLMIARIGGREIRVSELGVAAHAPDTLTRDYVAELFEAKLIECYDDAEGRGDFLLALSSDAARRMAKLYRARMRG